jgi:hypothetical protein
MRTPSPVRSVRFRLYQRPDGEVVVTDLKTGQQWYCGDSLDRARQIQTHLEALAARH